MPSSELSEVDLAREFVRSSGEVAPGEAVTVHAVLQAGTCRSCGCTDEAACVGGCSWVDPLHTLCSACVVERTELYRLEALLEDLVAASEEATVAALLGPGPIDAPGVAAAVDRMRRLRSLMKDLQRAELAASGGDPWEGGAS